MKTTPSALSLIKVATLAFVVASLSVCALPLRAQVATGTPPFGSFSGGSDIVNNGDLNVHLDVPVLTKAGRQLPLRYVLSYDSSVWYPSTASGTNTWAPVPSWGWMYVTSAAVGQITYKWSQGFCHDHNYNNYYYDIYSNWVYLDTLGVPHQAPGTLKVSDYSTVVPPNTCTVGGPAYTGQAVVPDSSGYTISVTADPAATTYSRSGHVVSAPLNSDSGSGSHTDTNGNVFNGTSSTITDTLNQSVSVSGSGTPSSPITYTYTAASGNQATVTANYTAYAVQTNFGCSGIAEYAATAQNLVSSISLADGTSYSFTYEVTPGDNHNPHYVTGRPASVTLPTGGTISYGYSGGSNGITCTDGSTATLTRTTPDGAWTYAHSESGQAWTTTVTDPQSNVTTYNFQSYKIAGVWDAYETERQIASLETIYTCYGSSGNAAASFPCNSSAISLPITQQVVTTSIGGLESQSVVNFDWNSTTQVSYGLTTEVDEHGYGSGAVGSLVRKTTTAYNTSLNNYIVDRPSTVSVYNGGGTLLRQASYSYDGSGLTSTSGTPQHSNPSGSRGNLTGFTLSGSGFSNISRSATFYDTGGGYVITDFNGAQTTHNNGSGNCGNSFDTQITMPMSMSESLAWNCGGAVKTSASDVNGNSTTFTYDNMNRQLTASYPDGGLRKTQYTSATVTDFCTLISGTLTGFCSGTAREDEAVVDGLGRTLHLKLLTDPAGTVYTDTTYDSLGRVATRSNPYRSTSDSSYGTDTFSYDAMNRVTKTTHYDGNYNQVSYGTGTETCSASTYGYGYPALYTDESGNQRRTFTDALGRVVEVDEPDPSNGNSLTLNTCYGYDAQGNLTSVVQGSQTRSYSYDGLSRLTQSSTPEGGTTNYYYTASGGGLCANNPKLVCRKTDARSVTITYSYDSMDRLTQKSYSDSTPTANFYYDETSVTIGSWTSPTLTNTKGRLTHTTAMNGSTLVAETVHSYDTMGRDAAYYQCTPLTCPYANFYWYNSSYNYDLAGDLASEHVPANFTVTNTLNAAQQITQVQSSLYDNTTYPQTLGTFTYAPFGGLATLTDGCEPTGNCVSTVDTYSYNSRLQPTMIQVGTASNTSADSCLVYNYYSGVSNPTGCATPSQGTSGNNGNAMGYFYQDSAHTAFGHTASFTYDSLNRLATAAATGSSTYNLTFEATSPSYSGYDRYGNMTCISNARTNGLCPQLSYDASNHLKIIGTGGSQNVYWDAAGNITQDWNGSNTRGFTWDAEGRLTSVSVPVGTTIATYQYNALGQRVERSGSSVPNGGTLDEYYDAFGGRALIINSSTSVIDYIPAVAGRNYVKYQAGATFFMHTNTLGSAGLITSGANSNVQEELFYPWGQQWAAWEPWGGLYSEQFASLHERDPESGLDPTQNRMFASQYGRWLSTDPEPGCEMHPQSENLYAYVTDNPATSTDPSGLFQVVCLEAVRGRHMMAACGGGGPPVGGGGCPPGTIIGFGGECTGIPPSSEDDCLDAFGNPIACPQPGGGGGGGGGGISVGLPGCDCFLTFGKLRGVTGCTYTCACPGDVIAVGFKKCSILDEYAFYPCPNYAIFNTAGQLVFPHNFCNPPSPGPHHGGNPAAVR